MPEPSPRRAATRPPGQDSAITETDEQQAVAALEGLSFPAGRHVVIAHATDRGGIHHRVLHALDLLPDRTFSSADDVVISLPDLLPCSAHQCSSA